MNVVTMVQVFTMCHREEADGKTGQTDGEEFTEYGIVVIPVDDVSDVITTTLTTKIIVIIIVIIKQNLSAYPLIPLPASQSISHECAIQVLDALLHHFQPIFVVFDVIGNLGGIGPRPGGPLKSTGYPYCIENLRISCPQL